MIGKDSRIIMQRLLLMLCMLKKKRKILLMFQKTTQIVKTSYSFNDSKWKGLALSALQ